ncbi:MAG: hypothetical protein CMJ78_21180 [Planctomycetaceae bacterium]|nr:hypothetical protein [Planctomycetaceae bacterium]
MNTGRDERDFRPPDDSTPDELKTSGRDELDDPRRTHDQGLAGCIAENFAKLTLQNLNGVNLRTSYEPPTIEKIEGAFTPQEITVTIPKDLFDSIK